MKFWFGKKNDEHAEQDGSACDVLTVPDRDALADEKKVPTLFVAPAAGGLSPVSEEVKTVAAPSSVLPSVSELSALELGASVKQNTSESDGEPAGQAGLTASDVTKAEKGADSSGASAENKGASASVAAKAILRPVGETKPAGVTAGGAKPILIPVSAAKKAPGSAENPVAGAGPHAVTFGLRPRANGAGSQETHAPVTRDSASESAPTGENKSEDRSALRPRTDQRALYYELMNGLYDAILILDDQGHVVDSNSRVANVLGYTREDSWDLPINKVITGMSTQMFEHLRRNLSENHHVLIDARCFRRDGTSFMGEVGVSTLSLTRDGTNIVFAIRNVERRKSAMEEMRKSQMALQVALVPAFVCDTEGFFQIVNQAFLDAFGIPNETQAKSIRFADLVPDAARFFLRAVCGEKIREKISVATPNGQSVKIDLSVMPVQSGSTVTAVAGSLLQF